MTDSPLVLAALAAAAVPGLKPVAVREVGARPGERFRVVFVDDTNGKRWVVRLPVDQVAAAQQAGVDGLLKLLAKRLPCAVPLPTAYADLPDGRKVVVYPYLDGDPLDFAAVPPGRGLAVAIGHAMAAVHDVDRRLYEEAGVPVYDAEECRRRHVVEVDRGAQTRRVPNGLLARWERLLDDVSLWRFAPTPVHGRFDGRQVLAGFTDHDDAASGSVTALLGWDRAVIGDPAEDFARIVADAPETTTDTVLEAYAGRRHEQPDARLIERATLVGELRVLGAFLAALASQDQRATTVAGQELRRLDAEVGDVDAPRGVGDPTYESVPVDFAPGPSAFDLYHVGSPPGSDGDDTVIYTVSSPDPRRSTQDEPGDMADHELAPEQNPRTGSVAEQARKEAGAEHAREEAGAEHAREESTAPTGPPTPPTTPTPGSVGSDDPRSSTPPGAGPTRAAQMPSDDGLSGDFGDDPGDVGPVEGYHAPGSPNSSRPDGNRGSG